MRLARSIGLLGAIWLAMAGGSAAFAQARPTCDEKAVRTEWDQARAAYGSKDMAKAKTVLDRLISECPRDLTVLPRVMRAEIALRETDFTVALDAISDLDRSAQTSVGAFPSFIALASLAGVRNAAGFAAEKAQLLKAVEHQLTDPDGAVKGRVVERFSAGGARLTAIEGVYRAPPFVRHLTFLIDDEKPFSTPRTVTLTTSPLAQQMLGPREMYYVDAYDCTNHATLELIPDARPDYARVRDLAVDFVEGRAKPTSGLTSNERLCAFSDYIAPGLKR